MPFITGSSTHPPILPSSHPSSIHPSSFHHPVLPSIIHHPSIIHPSIHDPPTHPSIIHLPTHPPTTSPIYLSIHQSFIHPLFHPPICPSIPCFNHPVIYRTFPPCICQALGSRADSVSVFTKLTVQQRTETMKQACVYVCMCVYVLGVGARQGE